MKIDTKQLFTKIRRKVYQLIMIVSVICLMTACNKSTFDADEDTIYIQKNGKVIGAVVEDFKEDYYDMKELKKMIETEVKAYNEDAGEERIHVQDLSVDSKQAKLFIDYMATKDYMKFNNIKLFEGTVSKAKEDGYEISGNFKAIKDGKEEKTTDFADLKLDDKIRIIISEEKTNIQIDGTILYISDNVECKSGKLAKTKSGSLSYILYKS